MRSVFAWRPRAERFARLVDDVPGAGPSDVDDPRYAELLAAVGTLRSATTPGARPEFVADLRERLVTAAETELAAAPAASRLGIRRPTAPGTRRERRVAAAVGAFAVAAASGSMAVAAQSSLPGDTLYPLKRGIENVRAGLSRGDDGRGAALLGDARGRLDEVGALSRDGGRDPDLIVRTLRDFSAQAGEASEQLLDDYAATGETASIDRLRDFTASAMGSLQELEGVVPDEARAALGEAADTLARIDRLAVEACPTCRDLPVVEAAVVPASALIPGLADAFAIPAEEERPTTGGEAGPGGGGPTAGPDADPASPPATSGPTSSSGSTGSTGSTGSSGSSGNSGSTDPGGSDSGSSDGGSGGDGRGPLAPVTEPVEELTEGALGNGQDDGGAVGDLLTGTADTADGLLGGGGSGGGSGGGLLGP